MKTFGISENIIQLKVIRKSHVCYNGNNIYKRYDNNTSINNVDSIKNTDQHFNDISNYYKMNNIPNIQQHLTNGLSFHMNHTGFMFQRNNTNHKYDNRRAFIAQQSFFTYHRQITLNYKFNY